jgi:Zn-dependent peptidase ImmA (M78 family)/transcriptional regulator with XRE-family HTH domain
MSGSRLRQARELAGLTQTGLAAAVGVGQGHIHKLETDQRPCPPALAACIALRTGVPVAFLERPPAAPFPEGSLMFRAKASMPAWQEKRARRYGEVVFEVVQRMLADLEPLPVRLPNLSHAVLSAESAARVTRSSMGLPPHDPISGLTMKLERAGVIALAVPIPADEHAAFSCWAGEFGQHPVVCMFQGLPADRLRLTLAHEVAHLVLHRGACVPPKAAEAQASAFAAAFLMPARAMRREIRRPVTLVDLATLKQRWGVSMQALAVRARDLEIITPRQMRYLFQQIGMRGWRRREPGSERLAPEVPRGLRKMAEMVYGNPVDVLRLASDVALEPHFIRGVLEGHATLSDVLKRAPVDADDGGQVVPLFANGKNRSVR